MLGYFITAVVSATVTMIVMACLQVGKDPNEDIQQVQPPRHEPIYSEPPQFTAKQFGIVNVWAEAFLNHEELDHLSRPDPEILITDKLKRKLADSMWEYATVTRCDDPKDFRSHYIATIKVVDTGNRNIL